jgi:imidazolonepropionase-like amidohydrolase
MHVHLDSVAEIGGYNGLQYSDASGAWSRPPTPRSTLEAGFTTVRNVGSADFDDVGLREAIDEGYVPGPRIVTATYAIGATGGHCDSTFFPPSMDEKSPYNIDSPDEGRKVVRTLKKYGAQVIKICATGGVFSHGDEPGQQQLTLAEMQAIVDEAHMAGLKVAAHAHGAAGIKDAIKAGVDTIEHASLVDDEGIKLAVQHGTYFSMDIYNTDYTQAEGAKNGVLEDNLRKDRDIGEIQRQNFRKALKAGVKMIYGTDAGVYPHGDNAGSSR